MPIKILQSAEDLAAYDQWVKTHEHGSLWQSLEWKEYQESIGREVRIYAYESIDDIATSRGDLLGRPFIATALVVIDHTSFGLSTWNIARGPLIGVRSQESGNRSHEHECDALMKRIVDDAKADKCLSLYLSPVEKLSATCPSVAPKERKWVSYKLNASPRHEQPEATRILDLTLSDEQLLAQMHQKGRYNINVARKNTVIVERSTDIDAYYALAQKTGKRDAFGIPSKRQLKKFLENLEESFLLLAYLPSLNNLPLTPNPFPTINNLPLSPALSPEGRKGVRKSPSPSGEGLGVGEDRSPIAGLLGVMWNNRAFYYYGASDYEHRALMAPYLLQWEAIQLCKQEGCTTYDLLGIAPLASSDDSRSSKLEARSSSHPWSGISSFKEKFGGTVVSYPPEQEITLKPMVKRLLEGKRKMIG